MHRLQIQSAGLTIGSDDSGCWAQLGNRGIERAPQVPLLVLEIYDRDQLRLDRLTVDKLERVDDAIHVVVSDRTRCISVGAWIRPLPSGGFSISVSPAEVYESRPELYRLFSIDVMPGLMCCGPDGQLLLPVNTGVLCRPAGKPARSARFLIYGEQACWELLPTMPVCAMQSGAGGMVALAAKGAAETECRVSTDGDGHGTVGLSFFWRSHDQAPVEQDVRLIRYHPIAAGRNITAVAV